MFFLDAWFKSKKSETRWLTVTRSLTAAILLAAVIVYIVLLVIGIGNNTTFFQSNEQAPDENGIPIPGIHLCSLNYNIRLANMTYRENNPKVPPPNGTIELTCMLQMRNPDVLNDCTQWLHPASPLIPIDQVYTACYHIQIPQTEGNVWYAKPPNALMGLTLAVALPVDYVNWWGNSTLSALFFDGQYDPYVALYAMPPTSNNLPIIDPKDLEAIAGDGSFEHVPRNKYKMDLDFNRFTTAWFHRFITHRNFVDREAWKTFRNYLGFPQMDKISSVDVWESSWSSHKASPGDVMVPILFLSVDMLTETVQTEIRVHTVLSAVSSVGGFASILAGLYAFLFGVRAASSWGVVQTLARRCCGMSTKKKLEDSFLTKTGMPLADKTNWRHRGTTEPKIDVDVLAERLQALEDLLNEYFVNSQFLKSMRKNGGRNKPHRTSVCPQDNNDV